MKKAAADDSINVEEFLSIAAGVADRVPSEAALPKALEDHLFRHRRLRLGARCGYLAVVTRDLAKYSVPYYLCKDAWDKRALDAFQEFFSEDSPDGTRILEGGSLYKHLLFGRDWPLKPKLIPQFTTSGYVSSVLKKKLRDHKVAKMGPVIVSPLIGKWRRLYMLMVEFNSDANLKYMPIRHAHDILVSRIGFYMLGDAFRMMKYDTHLGDMGRIVHDYWRAKVATHAEVIAHSQRVAQIAMTIAEQRILKLNDKQIALIALAALAHDYGKVESSDKLAAIMAEDLPRLKLIRKSKGDNGVSKLVAQIRSTLTTWREYQRLYNAHPVSGTSALFSAQIGKKWHSSANNCWWLLAVLCHHMYDIKADDGKDLRPRVTGIAGLSDLLGILGLRGCKTCKDVYDNASMPLWKKAINIVAMSDDIDGTVFPSCYRPVPNLTFQRKMQRIKENKGKIYMNEVIVAMTRAEHSIEALYSAPANLANL